jgi:hypothetical protein
MTYEINHFPDDGQHDNTPQYEIDEGPALVTFRFHLRLRSLLRIPKCGKQK